MTNRFLWVHFQLQDLCEATSDQAIRAILDHLPNGLQDTYVRILDKIEGGTSQVNRVLVQRALKWVALARRPLALPELQEAVAFHSEDDRWEADKIPNGDKLIGLCHGLIVRSQDCRVRFAHHTVHQHLLRPAVQDRSGISPLNVDPDGLSSPHLMDYYFTNLQAEFHLAAICATYLCFSDFESAMVKADEEKVVTMQQIFKSGGPLAIPATVGLKRQLFQIPYRFLGGNGEIRLPEIDFLKYGRTFNQHPRAPPEMRDKYALLDYVIQYWPWHTNQRLSKNELEMRMSLNILDEQTDTQFDNARGTLPDLQIGSLSAVRRFWNLILHKNLQFELRPWGLNQHFGLYGCQGCPPTDSQDRPLQRSRWTSLIHWAAEMGHVPLIQATSVGIMDLLYHERYHHQTLKIACANEQSELISYMLTAGTEEVERLPGGMMVVPATGLRLRIHQTPYLVADWIEFCCESGAFAGLMAVVDFGERFHNNEVVRGALLKGAFAAASNGQLPVMTRLLDSHNIDFRAEDATTMTLLHVAARNGHAAIVKEILRRGTQLSNLQNALGETPLILASQGGHTKVVELLLKDGAKVLIEGGEMRPLPHEINPDNRSAWVGDNGWDYKLDPTIQRPTAIHLAATSGDHNLLSKLLMSETFREECDSGKCFPPILSTLSTRDKKSPRLWLDPLECAAVYGKDKCVELLLTTGWRLNKPVDGSGLGSTGSIALHLAVTMGHQNIVRLLLQNNADPDSKNEGGMTLLHFAADAGRTTIIALLLEFFSQPDLDSTINRRCRIHPQQTPLQLAIEQGHSEAVEKLIKYGADPQMEYWTMGRPINALHLAIKSPKAESATLKAVCVRGIPRSVNGSSDELSDQNLLALAIVHRSPDKLQTLFNLGLRDSDDVGPKPKIRIPKAPYLINQAIRTDQPQCIEVLLANCSYDWQSLMIDAHFARQRKESVAGDRVIRAAARSLEILEKKLMEMPSAEASPEGQSPPQLTTLIGQAI